MAGLALDVELDSADVVQIISAHESYGEAIQAGYAYLRLLQYGASQVTRPCDESITAVSCRASRGTGWVSIVTGSPASRTAIARFVDAFDAAVDGWGFRITDRESWVASKFYAKLVRRKSTVERTEDPGFVGAVVGFVGAVVDAATEPVREVVDRAGDTVDRAGDVVSDVSGDLRDASVASAYAGGIFILALGAVAVYVLVKGAA